MIVDSSAIIAVLTKEPGYEELLGQLATAEYVGVGAPTMVETSMVLRARMGPQGMSVLARLASEADFDVIDFTAEHWAVAADAFAKYGKGRHKAALSFGDCLTYAVAKLADRPLLFKGDDFPHTDLDFVIAKT